MARERPPHSVIKEVYKRDNYTCQNCGRKDGPNVDLHAHHGVPLKEGGSNKKSNLITYCTDCHKAIHHDSHKAPSAKQSRSQEMSVKERVMKYINDPDTHCFECLESWEEGVDYDIQDTFEFLEYDSRPREFVLPSKGRRTGSVAAPYHIRCSNCGTLYGRAENGIATVEFHDEGISDKWYYGIIASVSLFTLFGGVRYLLKFIYGSGYESQIISTGIVFAFFALPVSIYYDVKYLRGSGEMNPHLRNWVQASFIPVVNILVALLYLKTVRNIRDESDSSPVTDSTQNQHLKTELDQTTVLLEQFVNDDMREFGEHISSGMRFYEEFDDAEILGSVFSQQYSENKKQVEDSLLVLQDQIAKLRNMPREEIPEKQLNEYDFLLQELSSVVDDSYTLLDKSEKLIKIDDGVAVVNIDDELEERYVDTQQAYKDSVQSAFSSLEQLR